MWMYEPAEKAMVSWTTPTQGTAHFVYYDTVPRERRLAAYAKRTAALPAFKYTMAPEDAGTPEGWAQNAFLQNLEPATTYYFVMVSDQSVSREFHFITAPADDRAVKVIYGADSRLPTEQPGPHLIRRQMNRLISSLVEEQPGIIAFAHGGDYCFRSEWRFLSGWLSDHELTITSSGRVLPIIPARGNHEARIGFEEVFFWPDRQTAYYYSTELSRRAVLVTMNTNLKRDGVQFGWLDKELARHREEPDKLIAVQYHVPAYPSVKPDRPERRIWSPLLERHGVNLVCEADDHMLKRTVPIYNDRHDPERGIVYIGDGGLGVRQRDPDLTHWYLKSPGFARPAHHVHVIEFAHDEILVSAVGINREFLDRFTVRAGAASVAAASR